MGIETTMREFKRKFRAMNTDVVAVVASERKRRREAERALDGGARFTT